MGKGHKMKLRPRFRQGRCYELAWRFLVHDSRFVSSWDLVHGEITSPIGDGEPIGHAWLISQKRVYDPVSDSEWICSDYLAKYGAKPHEDIAALTPWRSEQSLVTTDLGHLLKRPHDGGQTSVPFKKGGYGSERCLPWFRWSSGALVQAPERMNRLA